MKQKKLKGYVLPTIYVLILMLVFGAVSLVTSLLNSNKDYLFSIGIISPDVMPVVEVQGNISEGIIKPFVNESVVPVKYFYDINDSEEEQRESLIYYQNTYMKNTGILYQNSEEFECVSVLNGTVINIYQDDILGGVVEVEHNTNLRTIYYSLDSILVKVGDTLNQGEVIGKSGANNITEEKYNLLFEVYYNGTLINPEDFYQMDIATLN